MHRVHTEPLSKEEKRALWDEIVEDFKRSQLSVRKYSDAHGLKQDHLSYYVQTHKRKQASRFIPLQINSPSASDFCIECDGITVRLPFTVPSHFLRQLLSDVKASC